MSDTATEPSGRIFISYRRQDSAYPAGWLYDRLAERFGADQVFKDVDSIELGDDFVETITNAVGSCDILLALIGQEWLDMATPDGSRRLDDPDDFVRLEIEAALERKVLLIPILVEGALMPRGDQLPPSIAPMVRRQALELSPNRFRADTDLLLDVMGRTLAKIQGGEEPNEVEAPAEVEAPPPPDEPSTQPVEEETEPQRNREVPWRVVLAGVAAAAVVIAVIIGIVKLTGDEDDPIRPDAGKDPTATATEPGKLGGSGAPIVLAHRGGDEEFAWQTIPAYAYAAEIGAQVEADVRWTKDGTAVMVHDPGTTPGMVCDGGDLKVEDETWDLLRDTCLSPAASSKDGKQYPIPTFDQAVAAVAKYRWAQMFAEVKVKQSTRQVRQFVTILQSHKMTGRVVVTSDKPKELAKIRAQAEDEGIENLRTMLFVSGQPQPAAALAEQGYWGVAVKHDIISKAYVKQLNDAGMKVLIWVVNTPEQWQLADDVGADLVLTAKPSAYGKWAEVN